MDKDKGIHPTCASAEVGKTRMCVQEASLGVLMGQSLLCFSSTFTESVMMWMVGWTSRDTRQALTM